MKNFTFIMYIIISTEIHGGKSIYSYTCTNSLVWPDCFLCGDEKIGSGAFLIPKLF